MGFWFSFRQNSSLVSPIRVWRAFGHYIQFFGIFFFALVWYLIASMLDFGNFWKRFNQHQLIDQKSKNTQNRPFLSLVGHSGSARFGIEKSPRGGTYVRPMPDRMTPKSATISNDTPSTISCSSLDKSMGPNWLIFRTGFTEVKVLWSRQTWYRKTRFFRTPKKRFLCMKRVRLTRTSQKNSWDTS